MLLKLVGPCLGLEEAYDCSINALKMANRGMCYSIHAGGRGIHGLLCSILTAVLLLLPTTVCATQGKGFGQDSIFALLDAEDSDQGRRSSGGSSHAEDSRPAKVNQAAKRQQAPAAKQAAASSTKPSAARAEDYYRAFEHVFRDPGVCTRCACGGMAGGILHQHN